MRKIFLPLFLLMIFVFTGCGNSASKINLPDEEKNIDVEEVKEVNGDLKITMLNVGQGDAFLIQTKSQNILIDTSDLDERSKLVAELDKAGVTEFDKIILTHPHADHIGGVEKLLKDKKYIVKEICDNGVPATSKLYLNYLKELKAQKINYKNLVAGDVLDFGDGVNFEVLYPTKKIVEEATKKVPKNDPNNESIVGRLTYKKFSMMFTGDAEKSAEQEILDGGADLKSQVLKSGHHGSYTASSADFVKAIQPKYVFISAGERSEKRGGNTYGHPHLEPLETYLQNGIESKNIFLSCKNGTVILKTDGKNISVTPENEEDWVESWINEKKKTAKK